MKNLIIAGIMTLSAAFGANAQDQELTPAAMAQITMSEDLLALGKARGEPVMILAAMRIRATLDGEAGVAPTTFTSQEDMLTAAREAAAGDDALLGVIDDIGASSSRRMCIYARNGVCY